MEWKDTPEARLAFTADVERMIADAGGVNALVELAGDAWTYVNDHLHVDPAKLKRADLEQAYTNAMHAACHLARLSYAVNGSLLDGGDARRYNAAKGGEKKRANDLNGTQAAKAEAVKLWPEANRKGWTATRFHTALTDAGHAIPYDTARKWLTKLRKTGKC